MKANVNKYHIIFAIILTVFSAGCKKYLDIPLPVNSVTGDAAFFSDASTSSVVTGLFAQMSQSSYISTNSGVGYTSALYTDETQSLSTSDPQLSAFYTNALTSTTDFSSPQWTALYSLIYQVNLATEKLNSGVGNLIYRDQWLGECYFMRAYLYLVLTNLYGDVPMTLTSDIRVNRTIANSPQSIVYQQIIADLKKAQTLLSADYKDAYGVTTPDRARPNKLAATALLARVYLYLGDWGNTENQANEVIANSLFSLVPPSETFLIDSKESIWNLATLTGSNLPVYEYKLYNNAMPAVIPPNTQLTSFGVNVALTNNLVNIFETGDGRFSNWVRQTIVPATATAPAATYYFPNKYKAASPGTEYNVVLRLAEQYLIRAEARAAQNNITGAQADLNTVRTRASLAATTAATKENLIAAILKERRVELFTEFGHRFFDLKRTKTLDAIMNAYAPSKGSIWSSYKQFWPRPSADLQTNPNIQQTPGY